METVYWKICTEKRKVGHSFEEDSYEKEPVMLESEVKTSLEVLGRTKLPVRWNTNRIISSYRDGICQGPNKNMSVNMENKIMAYRLEMVNIHPNF